MSSGRQIYTKGESNGKSVGIVGSGPAGLSCATYLARIGYDVTVYERKPQAGGLDTYGMAEYKMPQSVSLGEVEPIAALGVKFMLNTEIVHGATPETEVLGGEVNTVGFDLLDEWHDAIFAGVGLGETNRLSIPGEDLEGVYDALEFIQYIKTRDWKSVPLGKNVVVIGAGNTAIDAVTQAKRLGAEKVIMVYRRTEKDASAYDYEMELARKDGVEFVWQAAPVGIIANEANTHVAGLRCERTDGSLDLFHIECDMVIKATGQQKMRSFFETVARVDLDEKGRVVVNEQMQTSNPKIFAGGDCANGGKEAVDASQMGKLAAQGIHFTLSGEKVQFAGAK
jgi:glutamate synthase (NADPH/NADH) small chain